VHRQAHQASQGVPGVVAALHIGVIQGCGGLTATGFLLRGLILSHCGISGTTDGRTNRKRSPASERRKNSPANRP
jgi:hypothetical protein